MEPSAASQNNRHGSAHDIRSDRDSGNEYDTPRRKPLCRLEFLVRVSIIAARFPAQKHTHVRSEFYFDLRACLPPSFVTITVRKRGISRTLFALICNSESSECQRTVAEMASYETRTARLLRVTKRSTTASIPSSISIVRNSCVLIRSVSGKSVSLQGTTVDERPTKTEDMVSMPPDVPIILQSQNVYIFILLNTTEKPLKPIITTIMSINQLEVIDRGPERASPWRRVRPVTVGTVVAIAAFEDQPSSQTQVVERSCRQGVFVHGTICVEQGIGAFRHFCSGCNSY